MLCRANLARILSQRSLLLSRLMQTLYGKKSLSLMALILNYFLPLHRPSDNASVQPPTSRRRLNLKPHTSHLFASPVHWFYVFPISTLGPFSVFHHVHGHPSR